MVGWKKKKKENFCVLRDNWTIALWRYVCMRCGCERIMRVILAFAWKDYMWREQEWRGYVKREHLWKNHDCDVKNLCEESMCEGSMHEEAMWRERMCEIIIGMTSVVRKEYVWRKRAWRDYVTSTHKVLEERITHVWFIVWITGAVPVRPPQVYKKIFLPPSDFFLPRIASHTIRAWVVNILIHKPASMWFGEFNTHFHWVFLTLGASRFKVIGTQTLLCLFLIPFFIEFSYQCSAYRFSK